MERISQMPPKGAKKEEMGMLEYLEGIIGSDQYIEPIQQREAKVSKNCNNL